MMRDHCCEEISGHPSREPLAFWVYGEQEPQRKWKTPLGEPRRKTGEVQVQLVLELRIVGKVPLGEALARLGHTWGCLGRDPGPVVLPATLGQLWLLKVLKSHSH